MTRTATITSIFCGAMLFGCTPQSGKGDSSESGDADETNGNSETGQATEPEMPSTSNDIDLTGETGDASATDTGDDTGCLFVCPEDTDGMPPAPECDVFAQDCPADQKCAAYVNDGGGAWNANKCVPISGAKAPGDPCTAEGGGVSGFDDCEKGSMCWDIDQEGKGICVALCTGDQESPACGDPETACAVVNDGVLNLCLDRCDPLIQDCAGDDLCLPVDDAFVCILDASGDVGGPLAPCEFTNACDKGLLCLGPEAATECDQGALGCCLPYCPLSENGSGCPGAGQACLPAFEPQLPGFEDVGFCSLMN